MTINGPVGWKGLIKPSRKKEKKPQVPSPAGLSLTGDGSGELARVVEQPLPQLVPADGGGPDEDQGAALVGLGVVQGHLLVRHSLVAGWFGK